MKIEEIISEPVRNTSILKQNLKEFLEDNDEDNLLEDKTFKKLKQNDKKGINKASSIKHQAPINQS